MTREQALHQLKELIIDLKDNGKVIRENPKFSSAWMEKSRRVTQALERLNSCDADWVGSAYQQWYNSEILPNLPAEIKSEINKFNA